MNFLELCQAMAGEAGISGDIVATSGQVGEAKRVVNWTARAYEYLQNLHDDWQFMRRDVQFPTTLGLGKYTALDAGVLAGEFGAWLFIDEWRCFKTVCGYADEQPIVEVSYETFRRDFAYGAMRASTGRPSVVAVAPDQSLMFWPLPDAAYTIVGEQYRAPHILKADVDLPIFPARFHAAIMYRALFSYGEYEGDQTVMAVAQTELARYLEPMEAQFLPKMHLGGCGALA